MKQLGRVTAFLLAIAAASGVVMAGADEYMDRKQPHYTYTSCIDWDRRDRHNCDERWVHVRGKDPVKQFKHAKTGVWTNEELPR